VFSEVKRFRRIDGFWYLLDGYFLGQTDPDLLPLPACPECGGEAEFGSVSCGACGSAFAAVTLIEEEWSPPRRKPDIAAVLSSVVPGLGQTYNGQLLKGLLIAATCWTFLPWIAGVVDALRTAERINRKDGFHDLPRRPGLLVALHLVVFIAAAVFIVVNFDVIPVISELSSLADPQPQQAADPHFSSPDGRISIQFPLDWIVERLPDEESDFAARATSEDDLCSIRLSGRRLPELWQPCPRAREARDRLESEGSDVAHMECGTFEGHLGYRVDSYSPDRIWRRSLVAVTSGGRLVVISFACPASRQDELVPLFERIVSSLEFEADE
jgi:hypothetical protein